MDNYADPPKEGVHYIRVENPGDMAKVATISKETWETMSGACHLWWKKNASAEGMWRLTEELATAKYLI
jgi:uncharacterized protein YdaU (DUF1376 family)